MNSVYYVVLAAVILAVSFGDWGLNEGASFGFVEDVLSQESSEVSQLLFFGTDSCGNCQRMKAALDELRGVHEQIDVSYLDIRDERNEATLRTLLEHAGINQIPRTYPVIFIDDAVIIGEGRIQELELRAAIERCTSKICVSPLDALPPEMGGSDNGLALNLDAVR